jgi:DNA invertase Pin-like site-specific DNA recombinase
MRVWLYYRLSRDEDKQFNSLKNQYNIIESYALNNGHTIVGSSFDDNVSGMHFNRAGIDELTEAVENGMIDAVIVKDLSRLGRHKTQTALYIDYLRQNNVRVLSATESIDTFNEADDLIIGFKGLMNDYYARDGSRRVTADLRQKQRAGLVITPPFGYFKDKNTKQVVIVPEAAETIHLIFSSYLDGKGVKAIAAMLNENGNKTPALMQKHLTGKRLPEKQERIIKKYLWDATMVSRILQDESYTGTLICHKSERNKINKTNRATSPDEQFRHENFLPSIIPRDLWEQVQALMAMRKRESVRAGEGRPILRYSGLIACGDCGRAFTGKRVKQKNGERVEYICSTYLRYGKEHCGAHAIREEYLDDIVYQELQNTKHQYQALWTQLEKAIEGWLPKTTNTQQQLKKQRERIELLEEEVETILMERIRDKENAQRYDRMIAKREEQIANAQKRIEELENIGQIIRSRQAKLRKDIGLIDDILADGKISEAHLRMLIERIYVYETEGGLSLEIKVKAPFQNHTDSYENGVLTNSEIEELIGVS